MTEILTIDELAAFLKLRRAAARLGVTMLLARKDNHGVGLRPTVEERRLGLGVSLFGSRVA